MTKLVIAVTIVLFVVGAIWRFTRAKQRGPTIAPDGYVEGEDNDCR